jgi:hypothetical protein
MRDEQEDEKVTNKQSKIQWGKEPVKKPRIPGSTGIKLSKDARSAMTSHRASDFVNWGTPDGYSIGPIGRTRPRGPNGHS